MCAGNDAKEGINFNEGHRRCGDDRFYLGSIRLATWNVGALINRNVQNNLKKLKKQSKYH